MAVKIVEAFQTWLSAGEKQVGEVVIRRLPSGAWDLRHAVDAGREDLAVHSSPEAARHISNLDDAGKYRPLKTAPNLARGWRLELKEIVEVRRAVDYLYPAMIGVWRSYREGRVRPVLLRETLGRQTGMYRVTQKVTDGEARTTIDTFCSGCLKHRLWEITGVNRVPLSEAPRQMPLICHEACNLLVAEIRKVVKEGTAPRTATAA